MTREKIETNLGYGWERVRKREQERVKMWEGIIKKDAVTFAKIIMLFMVLWNDSNRSTHCVFRLCLFAITLKLLVQIKKTVSHLCSLVAWPCGSLVLILHTQTQTPKTCSNIKICLDTLSIAFCECLLYGFMFVVGTLHIFIFVYYTESCNLRCNTEVKSVVFGVVCVCVCISLSHSGPIHF